MNDERRQGYILGWWITLASAWILVVCSRSIAAYQERGPSYDAAIASREQAMAEYQRQVTDFHESHRSWAGAIGQGFKEGLDREKDPRYMADNPVRDEAAAIIASPGLVVGFWGLLAAAIGGAVLYLPASLLGVAHYSARISLLGKRKARADALRERRDDRVAIEEDSRQDVDEIASCLRSIDNGIRAYMAAPDQATKNLILQEMQASSGTIRSRMRSPHIAKSVLRDSALLSHAKLTVKSLFAASLGEDRIALDLMDLFKTKGKK